MAEIYVANHVTLDGVMQAPGRADEDIRGGFARGGWAAPRSSDEVGAALQERVSQSGGMRLLLGRRSYDEMLGYWNEAGGPFKAALNAAQKYVVSQSESTSLPWPNSTLLTGDVVHGIRALKSGAGADLCVMGSGQLIQVLIQHRLVDEFLLFVHPIVVGAGLRLFPESGAAAELELVAQRPLTNGVSITRYRLV